MTGIKKSFSLEKKFWDEAGLLEKCKTIINIFVYQ